MTLSTLIKAMQVRDRSSFAGSVPEQCIFWSPTPLLVAETVEIRHRLPSEAMNGTSERKISARWPSKPQHRTIVSQAKLPNQVHLGKRTVKFFQAERHALLRSKCTRVRTGIRASNAAPADDVTVQSSGHVNTPEPKLDNDSVTTWAPAVAALGRLTILCLSSDTGGGHRASAQALQDSCSTLFGDEFSFNTVDLWSNHSPWPFCNMPKSYFFLVKHPWLWRLNFRCSEPQLIHDAMFSGYAAIVARRFKQAFLDYRPHLIVSVHPLMQHVPLRVLSGIQSLRQQPTEVTFATVVTDLTRCHSTWFHPSVDRCFVANDVVACQARDRGLSAEQIICYGLPIRPAFSLIGQHTDKYSMRLQLGLDAEASTVMLIGGGEGMGRISAIAEAMSRRLSANDQLIVVCGRNKTLANDLASRKWGIKVVIKGFINNMADYMASCDCVITKAGPGTIAEALACGLPIVLNGCIPCQEEGNIPYVLENDIGVYSEDPEKIAEIVSQWFGPDRENLKSMSERARRLGRPNATFDIVRDLADMARKVANMEP